MVRVCMSFQYPLDVEVLLFLDEVNDLIGIRGGDFARGQVQIQHGIDDGTLFRGGIPHGVGRSISGCVEEAFDRCHSTNMGS